MTFFGLAVLIFQLLMEGYTFSGIFQGKGDPPPCKPALQLGICYSRGTGVPPYIPRQLHPLKFCIPYSNCLSGVLRRYKDPQMRPGAPDLASCPEGAETALIT